MDFYVRKGDYPCPFTDKNQKFMVKVITHDAKVDTPFLSREVLLEALKFLDAAEGVRHEQAQPQPQRQPQQQPHPQVLVEVPQHQPQTFTKPKNKNPGGLTDLEIESAKEFLNELMELIDNPPSDSKGRPRDGLMNSDIREVYLKYSNQFRDPVKALYPIIRAHVLGFQESSMSSWQ